MYWALGFSVVFLYFVYSFIFGIFFEPNSQVAWRSFFGIFFVYCVTHRNWFFIVLRTIFYYLKTNRACSAFMFSLSYFFVIFEKIRFDPIIFYTMHMVDRLWKICCCLPMKNLKSTKKNIKSIRLVSFYSQSRYFWRYPKINLIFFFIRYA